MEPVAGVNRLLGGDRVFSEMMKAFRGLHALFILTILGTACSKEEGVVSEAEVEELRAAAARSDLEAQFELGWLLEEGEAVEENEAEAAEWYRKAAERGHLLAQFHLGKLYADGRGVEEDDVEARKWFLLVAQRGDATAQFNVGALYYQDEPDERGLNYAEASRWFRAAAAQNDPDALYSLGLMYELGEGVSQSYEEALKLYRRAADQEHPKGMYGLASLYERGLGVEQDFREAMRWHRAAADLKEGDRDAQNDLAWLYATCREEELRDGRRAAKYALMANAQSPENSFFKDTLAAAYARNGWFEDAIAAEEAAIELIETDDELSEEDRAEALEEFRARLELYGKGEAFVDNES